MVDPWFAGNAVVPSPTNPERLSYVTMAMAIDPRSGFMLDMTAGTIETVWQDMANLLLKVCATSGVPAQIMVRRQEALTILQPLAQTLGIKFLHQPGAAELISQIHDEMEHFMSRH